MGILSTAKTRLTLNRSKKEQPEKEMTQAAALSYAPEFCPYSAFNISIMLPGDWEVRPDHRGRDFCFDHGYYRFEKTYGKTEHGVGDSVSFGLRWETTDKDEVDNETFIANYAALMEQQYKKSMKKDSDFNYESNDVVELPGGLKACRLRINYRTNNRMLGKGGVRVAVTNVALLHEPTRRRVIATIMCLNRRMEAKRDYLEGILQSLTVV